MIIKWIGIQELLKYDYLQRASTWPHSYVLRLIMGVSCSDVCKNESNYFTTCEYVVQYVVFFFHC